MAHGCLEKELLTANIHVDLVISLNKAIFYASIRVVISQIFRSKPVCSLRRPRELRLSGFLGGISLQSGHCQASVCHCLAESVGML